MMDNSFKNSIEAAPSILILLPAKPLFDEVAAGLSLYLTLGGNKSVSITCPTQMLVEFNRLVGVDKVTTDAGSKNLVIQFSGYNAGNIDRVSYDVEGDVFKLTVIPKAGAVAPQKDQVQMIHSGVTAGIVILFGGEDMSHFPAVQVKDLANAKLVHVGIKSLEALGDLSVVSFARPASSVSELVGTLIKESGWGIDGDIATNLMAGIEVTTRSFTSGILSANTFQMIADLIRAGGKMGYQAQEIGMPQEPIPAAPTQQQIKDFAQIMQMMQPLSPIPQKPLEPMVQKSDVDQKVQPEEPDSPPEDWLGPKIYKGTTVS